MIASFALRYFRARKSTAAINIIAWVSVSAIAVGAAALIIVLSVFNGFTGLVKSLYADFYPTLKITPATGKFMQLDSAQLQAISQVPGVAYLSQTIEDKAVLRSQQYQTIAILKGVDDQFTKVAGVQDHIIRGTYATTDEDVALGVLGIGLESSLMLDVENSQVPIMVYMPKPDAGVTFNPAMPDQSLNSGFMYGAGTFALQQEFDARYVITDIRLLRRLLQLEPNSFSALELELDKGASVSKVQAALGKMLGPQWVLKSRMEQNATVYNIMQIEKWLVYIFLSFILVIAAFNMIGSLSMLVIEKQKDIHILRAMGARNSLIRRIFLAEGMLIAFSGSIIGFIIGFGFCVLQQQFGLIKLGGGSFLVEAYPVELKLADFVLVFGTILLVGILASWYPASRAAKQEITLKAT